MAASIASLALAAGAQDRFIANARQLTFDGRRSGEGYFDRTGSKIIFQSEREPGNPFYQIYILDLTTGETTRVSPGVGKTTCGFFRPGARRVLFATTHLDPESEALQQAELEMRAEGRERRYAWDYDPHFDIFETDLDGGNPRRLTDAFGYDAEGSYSPSGSTIVFTSNRHAYPLERLSEEERRLAEVDLSYFAEIYTMNARGEDVKRLTHTPGYDGGPFFSPDGKRIVWRRFTPDGVLADIYSMNIDGTDQRRLTDFDSMNWAPFYHPSAEYIIFASNKHGFENFELYLVDAAGEKEPVRVTDTEGFDGLAVFDPDGSRLLWTSTRYRTGGGREGGQLYLAYWNHQEALAAIQAAPKRVQREGGALAMHAFQSSIDSRDLTAYVEYLASEELNGRATGSEGERLAAETIARRFEEIGLEPLAPGGGFIHEFEFVKGVREAAAHPMETARIEPNPHVPLADRVARKTDSRLLLSGVDFAPLGFSDSREVEGTIAFAGYGLHVRDDDGTLIYDSYADLDVRDRIVVVLRYVPERMETERRALFNRFSSLRHKAMLARERGAVGLLVVEGPNAPSPGRLIPLESDLGGSAGIVAASVTPEAAERMLASAEVSFREIADRLDSGEPAPGFVLEDAYARIAVELAVETGVGRNVVGRLAPTFGSATGNLVVGAHYDHLGLGGGGSLAREGERGRIHPGADDNASGTAAMLEIAERMATSGAERRSGVVFAAWSGEELGLLGSTAFLQSSAVDPESIVAYLNMDMVGRVNENKLSVQAVGSSPDWRGLIERKNVVAGFALALADDPYLPTDTTAFYLKKIPGLHFFSGTHEDYHRPTDTADRIEYAALTRVARFVESIASEIVGRGLKPAYAEVERSGSMEGSRDAMRVYLGTIPDYVANVKGLALGGVTAGSPADRGGLRAGDVIVEFGGIEIANIYDYTIALDSARVGEPVEVVVVRGGERVELTVTPAARR